MRVSSPKRREILLIEDKTSSDWRSEGFLIKEENVFSENTHIQRESLLQGDPKEFSEQVRIYLPRRPKTLLQNTRMFFFIAEGWFLPLKTRRFDKEDQRDRKIFLCNAIENLMPSHWKPDGIFIGGQNTFWLKPDRSYHKKADGLFIEEDQKVSPKCQGGFFYKRPRDLLHRRPGGVFPR